jgi:hypothetical protein
MSNLNTLLDNLINSLGRYTGSNKQTIIDFLNKIKDLYAKYNTHLPLIKGSKATLPGANKISNFFTEVEQHISSLHQRLQPYIVLYNKYASPILHNILVALLQAFEQYIKTTPLEPFFAIIEQLAVLLVDSGSTGSNSNVTKSIKYLQLN